MFKAKAFNEIAVCVIRKCGTPINEKCFQNRNEIA